MNEEHANDLRRLDAALRQPDDERHLDPDTELFPFVDGTADAVTRELVEMHVGECAMCRTELNELQALRRSMDRTPRPSRSRMRTFALAAMIVLAIGALLAWIAWRKPSSPQQSPQPPIVDAPRPQPPDAPPPTPAPSARKLAWQKLVDEALSRGSLPVSPIVSTVALRGHTLRGPNAHAASALTPAGVVIESDRPRFSWRDFDGGKYVATIYQSEREVANSGALERASWTPPRPLPRGRTYLWQVKVSHGDEVQILPSPPEPPALFHILGADAVRELAEARAARPDDHLLLAVLSARYGLVADAREHLSRASADVRQRIKS